MPELPLEDFRRDVISHLDLPDFAEVVGRDQRNRRRRRVVVASIVASFIAGTALAFGDTSEPRSFEPTKPNGPEIESVDATELLATVATTQSPETYRLNTRGDVLASWTIQSGGTDECSMQHAFTWRSADGATRNWLDPVGHRVILPLQDGFVVGGGEDPCESKTRKAQLTDLVYIVDGDGRRIEIEAIDAREDVCARDVRLPECVFSAEGEPFRRVPGAGGGTGWRDPDGTHWYEEQAGTGSMIRWARAGERYRQQAAPRLGGASLEVNGDVVFGPDSVGFYRTLDHGETWSSVDVSGPLAVVGCKRDALEWWTSTTSGTFAGVCRSPGGRLLIRSTDVSWTAFEPVSLDADSKALGVESVGEWLIADTWAQDGFWVSKDQGVSWEFLSWKTLR